MPGLAPGKMRRALRGALTLSSGPAFFAGSCSVSLGEIFNLIESASLPNWKAKNGRIKYQCPKNKEGWGINVVMPHPSLFFVTYASYFFRTILAFQYRKMLHVVNNIVFNRSTFNVLQELFGEPNPK